jgi:YgiT-type zinc finger domain-containing protein
VEAGLEDEEKVKVTLDKRFKEAFEACPVCGGELVEKRVEKLLKGGTNTAAVEVDALVCLRCGERFYPEETVRHFEKIRSKLPGFACRWRALDGARELRRIFERIDFGSAEYEARAFTRLKQLRYLQRTGQIDQDLFWSALEPAAAAATNNADRVPEMANE